MANLDLYRRLSALADLSEAEREAALAGREADELPDDAALESLQATETQLSDDQIAAMISQEARNFVIGFEVGSRTLYDRKYNRAIWPGGGSGVTIGIGYDIGVQSRDYLNKTWDGLLSPTDIERYAAAVGVTGQRAKALCPQLADIIIPWDVALEAYSRSTMPTFGRLVVATFPNVNELHPHSFGALFSLVFNRGARLTERPGSPTRAHMRNIRDHLAARAFDKVPQEFRDMKAIWAGMGLDGLLRRREAEAVLFQEGLSAHALHPVPAPVPGSPEALAQETFESVDHTYDGDAVTWEVDTEETIASQTLEARAPWEDVSWSAYEDSPDYRHIGDYTLKDKAFGFTAADLEFLLKANSFTPKSDTGLIIFALRGARLVADLDDPSMVMRQLDRDELTVQEITPDHNHLRCVIGVYNPLNRRLSGFAASTVPCRRAVLTYMTNQSSGNLTPTGLFTFTVDWHNKSNPSRGIPGCLHEGGRQKAVWRSTNNLRYDLADKIENHRLHGNNIHPAMVERSAEFSSFGCLVVAGNYQVSGPNRVNGVHVGEWARFRTALGLTRPGTGDHGKVVDMVILTGIEAAIASAARLGGQTAPAATEMRLRQGSTGPRVRLLETALGLSPTGVFGHKVVKALIEKQRQSLNFNDGVYSPDVEQRLGFQVLGADLDAGIAAIGPLESLQAGGVSEEDLLLQEIGLRAKIAEIDPNNLTADDAIPDAILLEGSFGDLKALGLRVFQRIERSTHALICGDNPADAPDRERFSAMLNDAAARGSEAAKEALQWLMTAALLLPPRLAEPIAGLIVKRVIEPAAGELVDAAMPAVEQTCRSWAVRLREANGSGRSAS